MRQFFAAGMAVSLLGAALLGAVYAFTASDSASDTASVGEASLVLTYTDIGATLGPNDGLYVKVGDGDVENTGDFTLNLSGAVSIDSVTPVLPTPGDGPCETTDFEGQVSSLDASVAPTTTSASFDAEIRTKVVAPEDCQGDAVDYTVTITGTT